ncbi:alpha-(1,3)-fucosyltransferase 4 [Alligator mississippiensis]|nr:alpha-(1,3)-fucosyltransferase 4 [Alligator mississippiensis]
MSWGRPWAGAERRRQQPQQDERGRAHAHAGAAMQPEPEPGRAPRSIPRWRRRVAAAGLTCTALVLCACLRDLPPPSPAPPLPSLPRPRPRPRPLRGGRTVLLWWEPFGRSQRLPDCRLRFNISGCSLSAERRRYAEAAAVLFHHRDLVRHGRGQLPPGAPQRPPGQRWVWMNFESPSNSPGLRGWGGLFNWTMSYRLDSDVFVPYGALRAARAQGPGRLVPPRKTKLVAWVISHWNEEHARVRYYRQLQKYLPVDVYGAQGLALKEGGVVGTVSEYKFYLAFENSQHTDYITEKLWRNAFEAGAVPVVLGPRRANYELFVPPDSFIHVDDFSSPRKLAVYLKFLDRNPQSYRRYFAWREKYDVHIASFWDEHYCRVCEALQAAGDHQVKTVQNLASWFES